MIAVIVANVFFFMIYFKFYTVRSAYEIFFIYYTPRSNAGGNQTCYYVYFPFKKSKREELFLFLMRFRNSNVQAQFKKNGVQDTTVGCKQC